MDTAFPLLVEGDDTPVGCRNSRVTQVETIVTLEVIPLRLLDQEALEVRQHEGRGEAFIEWAGRLVLGNESLNTPQLDRASLRSGQPYLSTLHCAIR